MSIIEERGWAIKYYKKGTVNEYIELKKKFIFEDKKRNEWQDGSNVILRVGWNVDTSDKSQPWYGHINIRQKNVRFSQNGTFMGNWDDWEELHLVVAEAKEMLTIESKLMV